MKWEYIWARWRDAPQSEDLDLLGEDGWELVAIDSGVTGWQAWFKRPKPPKRKRRPR